jgi:hypothetical protein
MRLARLVKIRVRPKRTPTDTRMFLLRKAAQGQGGLPKRRAIHTEEELKQYYAATASLEANFAAQLYSKRALIELAQELK